MESAYELKATHDLREAEQGELATCPSHSNRTNKRLRTSKQEGRRPHYCKDTLHLHALSSYIGASAYHTRRRKLQSQTHGQLGYVSCTRRAISKVNTSGAAVAKAARGHETDTTAPPCRAFQIRDQRPSRTGSRMWYLWRASPPLRHHDV